MAVANPAPNVIPFPSPGGIPARRTAVRSPNGSPAAVTVLPTARPAPLPTRTEPRRQKPPAPLCSAGKACMAYARLDSPAKLNQHNTTKIGNGRYCYRCREEILAELSRSPDRRHDSERAAAERWIARRLAPTAARQGHRRRTDASAAPSDAESEAT